MDIIKRSFALLKKHKYFCVILGLSLIFMFPLFLGFYQSHDSVTHLGRAAFYEQALRDFQIPPRWAANSNYGYGSPFFIFFYPLSGYAIAILHLLGLSFETSFRLLAGITFLVGVWFFYLWISERFDRKIGTITHLQTDANSIFIASIAEKILTLYKEPPAVCLTGGWIGASTQLYSDIQSNLGEKGFRISDSLESNDVLGDWQYRQATLFSDHVEVFNGFENGIEITRHLSFPK